MTSLETKTDFVTKSNIMYPLYLEEYPKNKQGLTLGSILFLCLESVDA